MKRHALRGGTPPAPDTHGRNTPNTGPRPRGTLTGLLRAECYCRAETVNVAPDIIRAGRTGTCGRPRCEKLRSQAEDRQPN